MPERALTERRLDALLAEAAEGFDFPPTPAIAWPPAERATSPRPRLRPALLVALAATLLLAGAALAAGALGIGPLRILFVDALPSPTVPDEPLATRLALGRATTIDDPAIAVPILVPDALGPPTEVYRAADGDIASFVWAARDDLPATGDSAIGLLLMSASGDLDPGAIQKLVLLHDVAVEPVTVRGRPGHWITGERHVLLYLGDGSEGGWSRLVGDTLVWEEDGAIHRIESALGREATIAVAESMRPR